MRRKLIGELRVKGIRDEKTLAAMEALPRHYFLEKAFEEWAYSDKPFPIGEGQTISQPTIVAMMTAALALAGDERVLDVGTGSGYQAAILARLCREVVSVEVVDSLRRSAADRLQTLGIRNVTVLQAGDVLGAPELAPFDAILVAAAAPSVPDALVAQLAPGGRLVIPVGSRGVQELTRVTLQEDGRRTEEHLGACRFVPLIGPGGFESEAP